jgi:hypothetical protein
VTGKNTNEAPTVEVSGIENVVCDTEGIMVNVFGRCCLTGCTAVNFLPKEQRAEVEVRGDSIVQCGALLAMSEDSRKRTLSEWPMWVERMKNMLKEEVCNFQID